MTSLGFSPPRIKTAFSSSLSSSSLLSSFTLFSSTARSSTFSSLCSSSFFSSSCCSLFLENTEPNDSSMASSSAFPQIPATISPSVSADFISSSVTTPSFSGSSKNSSSSSMLSVPSTVGT